MTKRASTPCVGQPVVRVDADDKLRGKMKYTNDYYSEDYLHGATLRSPHPCALIKSINYDSDFDWSSVTVVTADDIQGENYLDNFNKEVPFLPRNNRVNYVGEAVLLIAGPTVEIAEEAKKHIKIDYEIIEPSLNVFDSLNKKNLIYSDDNIIKEYNVNKGDPESIFATAEEKGLLVCEGTYKTPYQEQAYIETQAMIAVPEEDGNGVTIYGSMQCPYYIRKEGNKLFPFPPENINIVQLPTGGGFGGKEHYPTLIACHAALLALKSKRKVKMVYERTEDLEATTKRHPSVIKIKTASDSEGNLVAIDSDIIFDSGAYSMASPVVLARGTIAGAGAYNCENIKIRGRAVTTNLIPTSAFRGFGAPQAFFAMERHVTRHAEKFGFDPTEFKRKNFLKTGDVTATGQHLVDTVALSRCIDTLFERFDFPNLYKKYKEQPLNTKKRRGVGFSGVFHGAGFTGRGEDYIKAKAGVRIREDGKVELLCSTTEMGQGMRTILPQIVAETMHLPFEGVKVAKTDTKDVPDSGPTVASRTTMIVGKVLYDASTIAVNTITDMLSKEYNYPKEEIYCADGIYYHNDDKICDMKNVHLLLKKHSIETSFYGRYSTPPSINWNEKTFHGDAYSGYVWAATGCELEVDLETYEITVLRLVTACDIGRAINPILVEGQIEGGAVQALGYALTEDIIMKDGKILNNRFANYIIPTSGDVPFVEAIIVEEPFWNGPFGAKGLGEVPCVFVAPCVADAVSMATNFDICEIPITPEKLFAFSKKEKK